VTNRRLPATSICVAIAALLLMAVVTTLTSPVWAQSNVAQTIRYGEVVAVDEAVVKTKMTNTGATVGATAGAVAGYALADSGDRWLGGLLGGVLGGAAGKGAENAARKKKGWTVIVKLDDAGEIAIDIPGKKKQYNPGDRVRIMTGPGGETKLQVITE
jgi:outer membrane lipoprotein SlyB